MTAEQMLAWLETNQACVEFIGWTVRVTVGRPMHPATRVHDGRTLAEAIRKHDALVAAQGKEQG